jgi:hypothetical protein
MQNFANSESIAADLRYSQYQKKKKKNAEQFNKYAFNSKNANKKVNRRAQSNKMWKIPYNSKNS